MPAKVRALAVPPNVMPATVAAESVPSATLSVTVSEVESTSAKGAGLAGQTRLPATSSVTVNDTGDTTVGASLTALIEIVLVFDEESMPSETVILSVLATVLLAAGVYLMLPAVLK